MSQRPPAGVLLLPVRGLPEVLAGADLAALLHTALVEHGGLLEGDLLVVSSKLVSKARGLRAPRGADRAQTVASQSRRIVAERRAPSGLTQVVEAEAGPVLAAAGVDASNVGASGGLLLLPPDPDAAAEQLHAELAGTAGTRRFAVVLSDTAGRPWREGQVDFALGAYGIRVLEDLRGRSDADGRPLAVTARAIADELAAAADLVKGKSTGVGAALVRGLGAVISTPEETTTHGARALIRTGPGDWFALGHREAVRAALGAPPGSVEAQAVGIPALDPEPSAHRLQRAIRLALLGQRDADIAGDLAEGLTVHAPGDPELGGRVAARLEVALAGEDLAAAVRVLSDP